MIGSPPSDCSIKQWVKLTMVTNHWDDPPIMEILQVIVTPQLHPVNHG
jgi:hypothetical protein